MDPEQNNSNNAIISWDVYEYEYTEKHSDWYWLFGIIAGLAIFLCILLQNFLLAIILLIGSFCLYKLSKREPEMISVAFLPNGIKIHNLFYYYKHLKSFAVQKEGRIKKLVIETDRFYLPHLSVPIGNIDPEDVRSHLAKHLSEKPFEESLSEKLFEFFGF